MCLSSNTWYFRFKKRQKYWYVDSWKSKGLFNSKPKPFYTAFLHSIKFAEYRIGIKLDQDPLAVEQTNYLRKIVNVYIVYHLDAWPRNPTSNSNLTSPYMEELA